MRIVAVIGAGQCDATTAEQAYQVGRLLAQRQIVVICGGLGGVMEAACRGAKSAGGLTIGVLPGLDRASANRWVDIPVVTGMGEARNVMVARTAHGVIAVGGEYGTLSEIAFALKAGLPVIGLNSWQLAKSGQILPRIVEASSPLEAVEACLRAGA